MTRAVHRLLCTLTACTLASPALALGAEPEVQTPSEPALAADSWQFSFYTYLWVPATDGSITVRGRTSDVDVSVSDTLDGVLDNFQLALTGHVEARRNRFSIFGDVMYIALENDVERRVLGPGEFEVREGFFEAGVSYAVVDNPIGDNQSRRFRLEPLAGARVYYLDQELTFDDVGVDVDDDQLWIDGFVGLRSTVDLAERATLFGRFDIGGGGSDLAWNAVLGLDVKLGKNKRIALTGGYRWLDIDYENGEGTSKFEFDVLMHGPFVGLGFTF